MNRYSLLIPLTVAATVVGLSTPARAEDLVHLQQLMNTRECSGCDLFNAGLVNSNLSGVDLSGADLRDANLNRANLRGANLQGANLRGAVLSYADLTDTDLRGADLTGADLREAYFTNSNMTGAILTNAFLVGAVNLPESVITADMLYSWGLTETQRGNYSGSIDYYNRVLAMDPNYTNAILARGISRYRLADMEGALTDAATAEQMYVAENNVAGQESALQLSTMVALYEQASEREYDAGQPNFLNFVSSLSTMVLRFLLR
ncbi:MAG TPA: pentapeptide repeat-containing protein [Candidatus Obscuribacterales bacterium]